MKTRANQIRNQVELILAPLYENIELLEGSLEEKSRFELRAYDPETQASLFKAHANDKQRVVSLLGTASNHLKTGMSNRMRITVHDTKHGMIGDYKLTKKPDGVVHTSGPSMDSFED